MNEALASGLPVIMTDISPNNKVLPPEWLVQSNMRFSFVARTTIEVYSADHQKLGATLDRLAHIDNESLINYKQQAYEIAVKEYSPEVIKEKWDLLMGKLGV